MWFLLIIFNRSYFEKLLLIVLISLLKRLTDFPLSGSSLNKDEASSLRPHVRRFDAFSTAWQPGGSVDWARTLIRRTSPPHGFFCRVSQPAPLVSRFRATESPVLPVRALRKDTAYLGFAFVLGLLKTEVLVPPGQGTGPATCSSNRESHRSPRLLASSLSLCGKDWLLLTSPICFPGCPARLHFSVSFACGHVFFLVTDCEWKWYCHF